MDAMTVVTFPTSGMRDLAGELPPGVRAGIWDLRGDPQGVALQDVEMVVVPHYCSQRRLARLREAPNLRVVQLPSAGYEHVLRHVPDGVLLANGRGIHDAATAELALGLILAVQRGIPGFVEAQQRTEWRIPPTAPSLADRTVLLIGQGSVGRAIEDRLLPFEVELLRVASRGRTETRTGPDGRSVQVRVHGREDLPDLLPRAQIVVLILPLTEESTHLVDARFLAQLPDGALLVNMARGRVVDTGALLAELSSGRLRAALDVTDPEPLPTDHPLWRAPNVLISPHQGGNATTADPRTADLVRRQLQALAEGGELVNVVRR